MFPYFKNRNGLNEKNGIDAYVQQLHEEGEDVLKRFQTVIEGKFQRFLHFTNWYLVLAQKMEQQLSRFSEELSKRVINTGSQLGSQLEEIHEQLNYNSTLKRKIEAIKMQTANLNENMNRY